MPTFLLTVFVAVLLTSCTNNKSMKDIVNQSTFDSLQTQNKNFIANDMIGAKNLAIFDTMEYKVFSNQQWQRLYESHSMDVKVTWPDGHHTIGIVKHIEDLKAMFQYAPNTSIKVHPIRFASGNMTCVTGIMTGTFSAPTPISTGATIQPVGKLFSISMNTIGIWRNGVMIEKYLFWDNQSYMAQIGYSK